MSNDRFAQLIRYALIAGGMGMAGWFAARLNIQINAEQVTDLVDKLIVLATTPAVVALATAVWGLMVKKGTVPVPAEIVKESEANPTVPTIPTVSSVTGKVQPGL